MYSSTHLVPPGGGYGLFRPSSVFEGWATCISNYKSKGDTSSSTGTKEGSNPQRNTNNAEDHNILMILSRCKIIIIEY